MAKRKIKIKRLPKGYKLANGEVIKTMALGGVPRDKANLEAEKGETVLTDLDNDGAHELYNIGGNRHSEGGTPLSLPPQSFIFSDTAKMKFSTDELAELGLDSKKKQTPAWASKRFKLNKFIKNMDSEHSDKISDETSELMLDKNKLRSIIFKSCKTAYNEGAACPLLRINVSLFFREIFFLSIFKK